MFVASAGLLAWMMTGFAGRAIGDRPIPRLSELLGFRTTSAPATGVHQTTAAAQVSDPAVAPTVAMTPLPGPSLPRTVSPVVAPATRRSHVVPSAPVAPRAEPAPAPAPVAPRPETPAALPPDGAPFVSHPQRRHGSLVSRVRRRQDAVDEPSVSRAGAEPHVEEAVTVISRTRRREAASEPRAPMSGGAALADSDARETITGAGGGLRRDLGMASTARKVGSLAREALLGYPFPADDAGASAPYAGEEPAPGQTVVLVGDDVEAWVRERLYGGRLPGR